MIWKNSNISERTMKGLNLRYQPPKSLTMKSSLNSFFLIVLFTLISLLYSCKKDESETNQTPTSQLIYRRWIIDTADGMTTSELFDEDTILLDFKPDQNLIVTFISEGFDGADTVDWYWSENPVALSFPDDEDTVVWPLIHLTPNDLWLQSEEGLLKCSPF